MNILTNIYVELYSLVNYQHRLIMDTKFQQKSKAVCEFQ